MASKKVCAHSWYIHRYLINRHAAWVRCNHCGVFDLLDGFQINSFLAVGPGL